MIKLINSRRRLLSHKKVYKPTQNRSRRKLAQKTRDERVKINQNKRAEKLAKLKNKNKPKKKKPKNHKLQYKFKYFQFQDYIVQDEELNIDNFENFDELSSEYNNKDN